MDPQRTQTCMNCLHRHEAQCRRYPPQVTAMVVPSQNAVGQLVPAIQVLGAWPQADEASWCGEWAGKFRLAS